jgi:GH24 family phage-related lysozyme (muramidase)
MRLCLLHSDINEDWRKTARNLALSGTLGSALGLGLHQATLPKQVQQVQRSEAPKAAPVTPAPVAPKAAPKLSFNDYSDFTSRNEGVRNVVYLDNRGIPTIGIGFNLRRSDARKLLSSLGYDYNKILSGHSELRDKDIWDLFGDDLRGAISDAGRLVSNFDSLPDPAKLVIVDMVFNLGPSKFSKFRKTIGAFERLDFDMAADEMVDSQWYHQVGNRSKRNVSIIRKLSKEVGEGF